jgi:capsular exopolysaccharide synthesis family protein
MSVPPVPQERPVQLQDYLAVLRNRKWSVIGLTLLVAAASVLYTFRQSPKYQSVAKVLVQPTVTDPSQLQTGQAPSKILDLETEAEVVRSTAVASIAKAKMESPLTDQQLLSHVFVSVPTDSQILNIAYTAADREAAQQGAGAFANAYLQFKTQEATDALESWSDRLQDQLTGLERQLGQLLGLLERRTPGTAGYISAQTQRNLTTRQIEDVRTKITTIAGINVNSGSVIGEPTLPSRQIGHQRAFWVAGVLIGLVLGLGLAFLRESFDDRLRGRGDLEHRLGAPVAAVVPRVQGWRKKKAAKLVMAETPDSPAAEAYKTLRTAVLYAMGKYQLRTALVTSSAPGEGKTATAVNLAVAMAQAGKEVILISADLRRPRVHEFLRTSNSAGLTDVLTGSMSLDEALLSTWMPGLRELPSGPVVRNGPELMGSDGMRRILETLWHQADVILIDTPPLVVSDPLLVAPMVDCVIYVADAASSTRAATAFAREQLARVGVRSVLAVWNDLSPRRARNEPGYHVDASQYGYLPTPARKSQREKAEWSAESSLHRRPPAQKPPEPAPSSIEAT